MKKLVVEAKCDKKSERLWEQVHGCTAVRRNVVCVSVVMVCGTNVSGVHSGRCGVNAYLNTHSATTGTFVLSGYRDASKRVYRLLRGTPNVVHQLMRRLRRHAHPTHAMLDS